MALPSSSSSSPTHPSSRSSVGGQRHVLAPTLAQGVAVAATYRVLLVVLGLPPILLVVVPTVLQIWLFVMDLATVGGCGLFMTVGVAVWTLLGRWMIHQYAPTPQKRKKALRKSRLMLPLVGFVTIQLLLRFLIVPSLRWVSTRSASLGVFLRMLQYTPSMPVSFLFRVSASMILLGLTVAARFVGPSSIGTWVLVPWCCSPRQKQANTFLTLNSSMLILSVGIQSIDYHVAVS